MLNITINLNDLNDKFDSWIEEQQLLEKSKSTLYGYKKGFTNFLDYLSKEGIAEVNKNTVISYKQYLLELKDLGLLKINTINQRLITLNKFFKETGLSDLAVKTEKQQRANVLNDMITESDYNRLIRWADKLGMKREKVLIETLATTGVRIDELKYFTVENIVNYKKGVQVTNKGKTRNISIPDKTLEHLKEYIDDPENKIEEGVIFHGRDKDKLLDKSQIWRNLKYIAGQARVKKSKVHAHSLRHLFSKRFLAQGGNISNLADVLGHASLDTTRIYTQLTQEELNDLVNEKMDSYL